MHNVSSKLKPRFRVIAWHIRIAPIHTLTPPPGCTSTRGIFASAYSSYFIPVSDGIRREKETVTKEEATGDVWEEAIKMVLSCP
eukprot:1190863-Prorocentrum_minimum.AAC.5